VIEGEEQKDRASQVIQAI